MKNKFFRDRYSILSFLIIVMILIVSYKLFSLQIVNAVYYKQESERKLLRINTVKAPRGEILDRFGKVLANNRPGFTVEITKTKTDDQTLNKVLLEIIGILEKNKESYKDNLPIIIPYQFVFASQKEEEAWKKKYKISLNSNPKQAFEELRKKYKIEPNLSDDISRKIITLRYEMSEQGYASFKSVVLAFDVTKETVSEIEERHLEFPGIEITVNPIRNYPNGVMGSHLLGYIGKINQSELQKFTDGGYNYNQNDIVGKSGIENFSEIYLKGTNGKKFVEADLSGRLSRALENQSPVPGGKVVLTIDQRIQKTAETALETIIDKLRSGQMKDGRDVKGGTAIAVDVNTGEILALASYPNFDPSVFSKGITIQEWNKLNNDPLKPLFNRAITGRYAPGSTFKMVTALAALQEGKVTIGETILDTGVYKFYEGYQPACWFWRQSHQTHGYVNVSEALKVSCNVYFYEVGRRLGINKLSYYAAAFGLDKKTNIELSGEVGGSIAGPETRRKLYDFNKVLFPNKDWYPGDTLQAAIGQSDTVVTPIAMASYISTLANGGNQYKLHLIKSQKSYDEKQIYTENSPQLLNHISIQPENLKAVFEGMKSVAGEHGGTAYNTFKDFPIQVAGKTGTSQTGIAGKSPHAWFAGFAPFDNPQIAVVVFIENGGSGGYTAPVAKDIFAEYFGLNNIPVVPESSNETEENNNDLANNVSQENIVESVNDTEGQGD